MAMTPEEQKIAEYGKEQGKTREQVMAAVAKYRRGTGATAPDQGMFAGTQERLAEVGGSTADAIVGNIQGTGEYADQSVLRRGVQATAAGFSAVPRGAFAMAPEPVRNVIEKAGGVIGKGFGAVTDFIGRTPAVENFVQNNPNATDKIIDVAGTLSAGGEISGNILGAQGTVSSITRAGSYVDDAARAVLKSSDDALAKVKRTNAPVTTGNFITKAVDDVRFKLSDIDPQVETVLKRSDFDEVNRYFQQARNAAADPAKSTPLEIAGTKAENAFDAIDEARKNAIRGKNTILANVADQRVPGNTINGVMSTGIQRMNEKFGIKIDAKGNVTNMPGRTSQLDATDTRLINEYFSKLNGLGVSPTVRQVDDFVDWAQSQLYKQSKTLSKMEVASDPVIRQLQGVTGELNGKLKATVGNGYGEVNARISTLIELQDELSRALGADARKGGGLMKTLFSPAGGNTRRVFADIQEETGIDLFKEATLAKYAMENVGDVRQASLLKQLDVAVQGANELDLTKPASIIRWLRENADLDGQALANEIMRRSGGNVDNPKIPTQAAPVPMGTPPQGQSAPVAPLSTATRQGVSSSKSTAQKVWDAILPGDTPNKEGGMIANPLYNKGAAIVDKLTADQLALIRKAADIRVPRTSTGIANLTNTHKDVIRMFKRMDVPLPKTVAEFEKLLRQVADSAEKAGYYTKIYAK